MLFIFVYFVFALIIIYFLIREKLPKFHALISIRSLDTFLDRLDIFIYSLQHKRNEVDYSNKEIQVDIEPIENDKVIVEEIDLRKLSNKEKGDEFEKFIAKKLSMNYFEIVDWRGDKKIGKKYAKSSHWPDLELNFLPARRGFYFAIECKYRSFYYNGESIKLAEDYRTIKNYKRYAFEKRQKVFVAIGMEGTPDNPDHVYIVPLNQITTTILKRADVEKYRRKNAASYLYFDYQKKMLN